jgi:hypothetical protein
MKHDQRQPARQSDRIDGGLGNPDAMESVAFAKRRDKRRRQARRKNRRG